MAQEKSLFDSIVEQPEYQMVLNQLPDDERQELLKALRKLVDDWENNILKPLQNLSNK